MRLPFLILAPVCALLGISVSILTDTPMLSQVGWIITAALLAHISVNMLNEYCDFKSGLDALTQKTPFSGGSGALPAQPLQAKWVLLGGVASLVATAIIGIWLALSGSPILWILGALGVGLVISYTEQLNRLPWLCLIAPGLGFGIVIVAGSHLISSAEPLPGIWLVALIPFFSTNNLLLLNQYPDMNADQRVGRRTFPIVYGITLSNRVFLLSVLCGQALVLLGVATGTLPIGSLVALLLLAPALFAYKGARQYREAIGSYPKYMAANVLVAVGTPLLLALSIILQVAITKP